VNIRGFARVLVQEIMSGTPSATIKNEAQFELEHVIGPAWELAKYHPEIVLCVHPSKSRKSCEGGCDKAVGDTVRRVCGCPQCWKGSKAWSVVDAYGLRHNFDLVARDARGQSLAVEVKWLSFSGGRGPNSEFQRFVGQCALAAAGHAIVLGICGIRGKRDKAFEKHTENVARKLKAIGVQLIILPAR